MLIKKLNLIIILTINSRMVKKSLEIIDKINNKIGVTKHFAIQAFIVMAIIGVLLVNVIKANVEEETLEHLIIGTKYQSETIITPNLKDIDANKPLTGKKLTELNYIIKNYFINEESAVRIKIWNKDGTVIYSDKNELIGQKFKIDEDLKKGFQGQSFSTIENQTKEENIYERDYNKLIEIFIPLYLNNKETPQGVYEVYLKTEAIDKILQNTVKNIVIYITLGLLFLYLTLIWSFKSVYKRINKQTVKLRDLNIELEHSIANMEENYYDTIKALTLAVDAKDHYTAGHSIRVADISVALAKELKFSEYQVDRIEKAALFHDIGKIGIPQEILNKPERLTDAEYTEIKKHPFVGAKILSAIKYLKPVVKIVEQHHEFFNGKGYPKGLKKNEIEIEARIISVADAYDAIITTRPHRLARTSKEALVEIALHSGTQFDPKIVKTLIRAIKKGDINNKSNKNLTGDILSISYK